MFTPFPKPLVEATLVRRVNRFVAEVELQGEVTQAHVPNTGRMSELMVPGNPVYLLPSDSTTRKTRYDLILVDCNGTPVCVDSRQANVVAQQLFEHLARGENGDLPQPAHPLWKLFAGITKVQGEVTHARHRIDFRLQRGDQPLWVEVKSVNLVVDGCAMFPDAPTKRGTEHIHLLQDLASTGAQTHVLFIVQRDDAHCFAPNHATDPAFAQALRSAAKHGVHVHALRLRMSTQGAHLVAVLPVELEADD